MKNQALTTTLAVLLAVALSAIAALVVSSEVMGSSETVVGEPVAIQIDVNTPAPAAPGQAVLADNAAPATSADETRDSAPANQDGDTAPADATDTEPDPTDPSDPTDPTDPVDRGPTDSGPAPDPGPATDDPAPAGPGTTDSGDAPETGPAAPADPADDNPGDDTPAGPDTSDSGDAPDPGPAAPADPVDDEPADLADDDPADPGDGPGSILCFTGYTPVGGECVFVGCPTHTVLIGERCVSLGVGTGCPEGQHALPGGVCLNDLVVVIPGVDALCPVGQHAVGGTCVTVCPDGHTWIGGFCIELVNVPEDGSLVNPGLLPGFDLELFAPQLDVGLVGG